MRWIWITILFSVWASVLPAADKNTALLPIAGNLSVALQDVPGHQMPIVDFFRRYERTVRQAGRFNNTAESKDLILLLNARQAPGSCQFVYSRELKCRVLQLPADWKSLLDSPLVGRRMTMALLQSRMGQNPEQALPAEAWWIADGLWAEFVQRENMEFPILHFTYLPELRNLAEQGFRMKLDLNVLTPPAKLKTGNPEFVLYTQRAQLMVEVASAITNVRQENLLKDYCFLLAGRRMKPTECFGTVFAAAAQKKINRSAGKKSSPDTGKQRFSSGYEALEKIALRTLFTGYAPMSPNSLLRRFNRIVQVAYQPEKSPNILYAELSDLPTILQRHPECAGLINPKIAELNELALLAPLQLRSSILNLNNTLFKINGRNVQQSTAEIKQYTSEIRQKLAELQQIDRQLMEFEQVRQPALYPLRYTIGNLSDGSPLPHQIRHFLEQQERLLMQQ